MSDFILENQIAFYYSLIGMAFLGLTCEPALRKKVYYNIPALYILVGIAAAAIGLPVIDPLNSKIELKVIEHVSELIVIVSLAGAGLAIDLKVGWSRWQPTWRLLMLAMPLTIVAIALFGMQFAGFSLAASILLGAALSPTDPVLARSVSVGSPNSDQHGTTTTLTSEAGLNDSLAFPFVWLAIGLAASGAEFSLAHWTLWYLLYKLLAGLIMGVVVGWGISRILFSDIGEKQNGPTNTALFVLAGTFLAYGLAEFVHGYGFLSVFIAARAGRARTQNTKAASYENEAHDSADQLESILLAVILLWFGTFIGGTLWHLWTWQDVLFAALIIGLFRPIFGWLSLLGHQMERIDRLKISFFGIRGMGTIFYVAYALSHAEFDNPERIWSIVSLTILISALLHGSLARHWMRDQ